MGLFFLDKLIFSCFLFLSQATLATAAQLVSHIPWSRLALKIPSWFRTNSSQSWRIQTTKAGEKKASSSSHQALNPTPQKIQDVFEQGFFVGKQNNSNAWLTCLTVSWSRDGEIVLCCVSLASLKQAWKRQKMQVVFVYSCCKDSCSSLAGHNNLEKQVLLWLTWGLAAFVWLVFPKSQTSPRPTSLTRFSWSWAKKEEMIFYP